ncbi:36377_t:CDS:2, partial [Gigaspora margarita]
PDRYSTMLTNYNKIDEEIVDHKKTSVDYNDVWLESDNHKCVASKFDSIRREISRQYE